MSGKEERKGGGDQVCREIKGWNGRGRGLMQRLNLGSLAQERATPWIRQLLGVGAIIPLGWTRSGGHHRGAGAAAGVAFRKLAVSLYAT